MSVQPIPEDYHSVTPYLFLRGASQAIEWYGKAFGAIETERMPFPDSDKLMHAEIQIGDSRVMLSDENAEMGCPGPETLGGSSTSFMIYVENADDVFNRAIETGAEVVRPLTDQFYGDRSGCLKDPFGHIWTIATHIEDVSEEEMEQRMKAMGQPEG